MAIFDDDFQSYSIGTVFPTGSWVAQNGSNPFTREIKAGGSGIPGTDRYLEIFLGGLLPDPAITGYQSSFTLWGALKLVATLPFGGGNYQFVNGPNAGGFSFGIIGVKVEFDGTISVYDGNGILLGNSTDHLFNFFAWNFIQIDCALSDATVLGVDYVHINLQLYLNGTQVISFSTTTGIQTAGLTHATSEVNQFCIQGGDHAAYTLDAYAGGLNYPHAGTPSGLIFQGAAELLQLPDDEKLMIHQGALELAQLPDDEKLMIHQGVIELILEVGNRWYISES